MPIMNTKRLLDAKGAAAYLGIGRTKLYYWMNAGKIRSIRIDSKRLFDVLDLDAFVERIKEESQKND